MLGMVLLFFAAQSAAEPARTVNGQELGPAEQFTTPGLATVCMRELVIRPRRGESVQLLYSGIHDGTLRLHLQNGSYVDFSDGESFVDQRPRGEAPVSPRRDLGIYLIKDERPNVRYQLEGSGRPTGDYTPPRVLVNGPGLVADSYDDRLFDEVSFADPNTVNCDRRYQYGWDVLLNGEPFDVRNDGAGSEGRH